MGKSFEVVEKVGVSKKCFCDAIEELVKEFSKEKKVSWFEVKEMRGRIGDDGKVEFQSTIKIGYKP